MKLLPFTEESLGKLRQEGYTHIVLKRIVDAKDRDYTSEKELHIYEAFPPDHPMLQKFISFQTDSRPVQELLESDEADCYIMIHN